MGDVDSERERSFFSPRDSVHYAVSRLISPESPLPLCPYPQSLSGFPLAEAPSIFFHAKWRTCNAEDTIILPAQGLAKCAYIMLEQ